MRLKFIGLNGSMGLQFGMVYRVTAHPWKNGVRITSPVICPYNTDKVFWQSWAHPDEDIRTIMESKGRELRAIHISRGEEERVRERADVLTNENGDNDEVHNDLVTSRSASEGADR